MKIKCISTTFCQQVLVSGHPNLEALVCFDTLFLLSIALLLRLLIGSSVSRR